jgi:hypothetical protein
MSKFTQFNWIKPLPKENLWVTTEDLVFYERDDLIWKKYVVPSGFKTDGCSVSCPLWQWAEPKTIWPCVLHDQFFKNKIWFFKSNYLFFKSLRANKNSIYKSLKFYLWVTSPIWYYIYKKKQWTMKIK